MGAAIRRFVVGDSFRGTETAGLLASIPEPWRPHPVASQNGMAHVGSRNFPHACHHRHVNTYKMSAVIVRMRPMLLFEPGEFRRSVSSSVSPRVKRQPVALAIEDDRPEAVRADLVPRLKNLTPIGLDRSHRLIESPLCVQIDEQSAGRMVSRHPSRTGSR